MIKWLKKLFTKGDWKIVWKKHLRKSNIYNQKWACVVEIQRNKWGKERAIEYDLRYETKRKIDLKIFEMKMENRNIKVDKK